MCVMIAACSAMDRAPRAMVTCMTRGRAMGTAPMTSDRDTRSTRSKGSPRTASCTAKTTAVKPSVAQMSSLMMAKIFDSKRPMALGPAWASATRPMALPISVSRPVSVMTHEHSPCATTQPLSMRRPATP